MEGKFLVSPHEVLEQLTLPNLQKIAKRLGIRVPQGLTGYLAQAGLGIKIRRPYITALESSGLVTLEEIDRILGTHYAKIRDEVDLQSSYEPRTRGCGSYEAQER